MTKWDELGVALAEQSAQPGGLQTAIVAVGARATGEAVAMTAARIEVRKDCQGGAKEASATIGFERYVGRGAGRAA